MRGCAGCKASNQDGDFHLLGSTAQFPNSRKLHEKSFLHENYYAKDTAGKQQIVCQVGIILKANSGNPTRQLKFLHRPHLRHTTRAQRTAGLGFGPYARFKCPFSGNRGARPRAIPLDGRAIKAIFSAPASGGSVRKPVIAEFLASVCSRGKRPSTAESLVFLVQTAAQRRLAVIWAKHSNDRVEPILP